LFGADLTFPITAPVLIVAIAMGIFLLAPLLMQRLRVPGLIGVLLAGALVGPHGLNLLARDQTIVLLGTVGLLFLMFLAGIEIDLQGFRRYRKQSFVFGSLTFLLPQAIGTAVGLLLGYGPASAILLASMFASHTLIAYPIVMRLGIAKNRAMTVTVGGTIITDTAALLVLAIVAASTRGTLDAWFWISLAVMLTLYVTTIWLGLPRLARWFFRHPGTGGTAAFAFIMTALFGGAYLAEVAGVEAIVGAFLVGLALNPLIPEQSPLTNRLHFVGEAIFIPFFLLSVGMLVDVRVLAADARVWQVMIAMTVTVTATKWMAAQLTGRIYAYSRDEAAAMFGLSVPQAAATLAATLVGLQVGLFDEAVLNGSIMMIVVTCILGPWVVERSGRRVGLQEEQNPVDTSRSPQRVLVPISNPTTAQDLLDLALIIRAPGSTEPLYPLTVVPADPDRSAENVATAERMLSHAVAYAAGADVPVIPVTRMDHNFASGIARGAAETRSSTLVMGWDGKRSGRRGVFGTVLDQVLEETRQQVIVAKLGHPLNTTRRLVVLIPHGSNHLPGFGESVRTLKLMANRMGASIRGLSVEAPAAPFRQLFQTIRPDVPTTMERRASWREAVEALGRDLAPDDLVVVLSSRRGSVPWTPVLERLPGRLADLVPESFIMIYPADAAPGVASISAVPSLPRGLTPRRIRLHLPAQEFQQAIRSLLVTQFGEDSARLREIEEELVHSTEAFTPEIKPGVVVPHARIPDLEQNLVFLGTSEPGIEFPGLEEPAHLVFIVLTSEADPQEHLSHLAEIAHLVSDGAREQQLVTASTIEEILSVGLRDTLSALEQ
jgi:Kef-type K+ transport system membrane component KefB/mannitol/fructose-specific phosphotransferase system IIA component (Ntr-type)